MDSGNAQEVWHDYDLRIRRRRSREFDELTRSALNHGFQFPRPVHIDFRHFASDESDIRNLAEQLAENYEVGVSRHADTGYWILSGTHAQLRCQYRATT